MISKKIAKAVEREARETTSAMLLLEGSSGDPPTDAINRAAVAWLLIFRPDAFPW